jgi:hypothetical protein
MLGKPRAEHFATKEDFKQLKAKAPEVVKGRLREIMEGREAWFEVGTLAAGQPGREDATHRVSQAGGGPGGEGAEVRVQLELREDHNALFYKMGWTLAEAEAFLGGAA